MQMSYSESVMATPKAHPTVSAVVAMFAGFLAAADITFNMSLWRGISKPR